MAKRSKVIIKGHTEVPDADKLTFPPDGSSLEVPFVITPDRVYFGDGWYVVKHQDLREILKKYLSRLNPHMYEGFMEVILSEISKKDLYDEISTLQ